MKFFQTAERVSSHDLSDSFVYQRSLLAYHFASRHIHGKVLEIGTGSGYGIHNISQAATHFVTIDKKKVDKSIVSDYDNCSFIKMKVPPFKGIQNDMFDCIICFQVLEHIPKDKLFIQEIKRVLKPNGILILTTPNKPMTLTRNPWHVREYSSSELTELLKKELHILETFGVFGNHKINAYYKSNKMAVEKIRKFDFFKLEHRLPGWLLCYPYDILNRINRKKLLRNNRALIENIVLEDYRVEPVMDHCFDLLYVAQKRILVKV